MRNITIFFILIAYLSSGICPLYSIIKQNENINSNAIEQHRSIEEIFPNGHSVCVTYNKDKNPIRISIPEIAEIVYNYTDGKISKISRLDNDGKILYTHTYLSSGKEAMIGDIGIIERSVDDLIYTYKTPYSLEICKYNENRNIIERVIDNEVITYEYDEQNRLLDRNNDFQDKLLYCDGASLVYDAQGNLIQKKNTKYTYDTDNRLVEVTAEGGRVSFTYDYRNRRISKRVQTDIENYEQTYLYYENIPIAIFKNGILKQLSIPGSNRFDAIAQVIAIEADDRIYAPIYDIQWNIFKLIDIDTKEVHIFPIDPFGKNLEQQTPITPWLFATKEYDPETNLVYFGHRYYDPSIQRWLTKDPLYQKENNLYTYCCNNPLRYIDPDGRFFFVLLIPIGVEITAAVLGEALLYGCASAGIAWAGAKGVQFANDKLREREIQKRIAEVERQNIQGGSFSQLPQKEPKKRTPGNMDDQVRKGQAPKSVKRVDNAKIPHEKDHINFKDRHALNHDGTWKHGGRSLTNEEKAWILKNGWTLPPS